MSGTTVAVRYARALYEVALKKEMVETIADDLVRMDMIMTGAGEFRAYCLASHVSRISQIIFVNTAFVPYVSPLLGEALRIAVRNGRLAALPYIYPAFKKIVDTASGVTEVVLESARKTEMEQRKKIEKKIESHVGGRINLKTVVIPELLGGASNFME